VTVRTGTESGAFLSVLNTGPAVPAGEVDELFQPFRRGGTARTGSRGAGLGLSIVRAVAAAHGGAVSAAARPEGGLEVTVRLPAPTRAPVPV
jgi:signal transduction histidine kinase